VRRSYHLYVKTSCIFCKKAVELLEKHALLHGQTIMDDNEDLLTEVKDRYNWDTVPLILELSQVEGVRFIGGYTDLCEYLGEDIEN
jgi:glutaredoxin|tara:strand:+ start:33 stop:290 length:258 start_codon:yes stop_codon:yes gene_type:complete